MKELRLLIGLTQLGLSVAVPLVGFPLLALWLQRELGWGAWTGWAGVVIGVICAIDGFRFSLKAMKQASGSQKPPPPPSFNEHL